MTALANYLQAGVAGRRGTREQAANHVRAALAELDWADDKVVYEDDWKVYLDDALEAFTCYVEEDGMRMVVSKYTWDVLACDVDATDQFLADMSEGGTGMRFIVMDREPFKGALKEHAKQRGNGVSKAKDAISDLTERANSLVVQAASLNTSPTPMQQQVFAVRYATLRAEYEALTERLSELNGLLDLAGTAVYDVSQ